MAFCVKNLIVVTKIDLYAFSIQIVIGSGIFILFYFTFVKSIWQISRKHATNYQEWHTFQGMDSFWCACQQLSTSKCPFLIHIYEVRFTFTFWQMTLFFFLPFSSIHVFLSHFFLAGACRTGVERQHEVSHYSRVYFCLWSSSNHHSQIIFSISSRFSIWACPSPLASFILQKLWHNSDILPPVQMCWFKGISRNNMGSCLFLGQLSWWGNDKFFLFFNVQLMLMISSSFSLYLSIRLMSLMRILSWSLTPQSVKFRSQKILCWEGNFTVDIRRRQHWNMKWQYVRQQGTLAGVMVLFLGLLLILQSAGVICWRWWMRLAAMVLQMVDTKENQIT